MPSCRHQTIRRIPQVTSGFFISYKTPRSYNYPISSYLEDITAMEEYLNQTISIVLSHQAPQLVHQAVNHLAKINL